ncbi:hypothetical protein ACOSQ3_012735 [Xanthoceras sorbifolium]
MRYHSKVFRNLLSLFSYLLISSINLTLTNVGAEECFCHDIVYFSDNGPYDNNRNLILSSLAPYVHINNGGFYNTSIGQDPNQVYALAL